jgi:hypothetical protein
MTTAEQPAPEGDKQPPQSAEADQGEDDTDAPERGDSNDATGGGNISAGE